MFFVQLIHSVKNREQNRITDYNNEKLTEMVGTMRFPRRTHESPFELMTNRFLQLTAPEVHHLLVSKTVNIHSLWSLSCCLAEFKTSNMF
jgi:hypothetical protein